jgi:iron(III) transport system substrate-binding protein
LGVTTAITRAAEGRPRFFRALGPAAAAAVGAIGAVAGRVRPPSRSRIVAALAVAVALGGPVLSSAASGAEVNIYSFRQEILIRPLLDLFTEQTGIEVNLVSGKADALLERLRSEGANSPADVLLTADAGRLIRAKEAGLLQPVASALLEANIPPRYRDPAGEWYGLSVRARPIIYARDRVDPEELSTYEALTDPRWRGRICIRSSGNIYNQSMLAAMIAHIGPEATEIWAKGLVANFARVPQGGDRDQIRAVAAGECDIAIVNTYYLARLAKSEVEKDREVAQKVAVFWPNQQGRGTHVNISGAGVTRSAKNRGNAIRLLEFLSSEEAQRIYAEVVNEYPVKPGAPVSDTVASWGPFKADDLNLAVLARHHAEAMRIVDRVGWR